MSQENVELVRSWFERWNRGERGLERELHPDVEIFSRIQPTPYRGVEGFRQWTREIDEQFQEWCLVVDDWRDEGDIVAALGHVRMRGHGSGIEFDQPLGWVIEISEGKLHGLQIFLDPAEALKAAGLSE